MQHVYTVTVNKNSYGKQGNLMRSYSKYKDWEIFNTTTYTPIVFLMA